MLGCQYVLKHRRAIESFFEGRFGKAYLIVGHYEKMAIEIADAICTILNEVRPISGDG